MADFDVAVVGGGPGGYAAALRAAADGASVALIERERPGGACVHHSCIPTNLLIEPAAAFIQAQELGVMGLFASGDQFNFSRAVARKDLLVGQLSEGVRGVLRRARVQLIEGHASFESAHSVKVLAGPGEQSLSAEAFIIATGARWELPVIPGIAPERILTPDLVQALPQAPASALVLLDGACEVPFGLEYAVLLAVAGAEVSVACTSSEILSGLDEDVLPAVRDSLSAVGIRVFAGASALHGDAGGVMLQAAGQTVFTPAEVVITADSRSPVVDGLGLELAGVTFDREITVARTCATNVGGIYAVGDVTGGAMLSSVASHMGEVAAINATGGVARARLRGIPRLVHGVQPTAWVGVTERSARSSERVVVSGVYDLAFNARSLTLGARGGLVKVIADRDLREILGVHVSGPEAGEIVAVAAALMQAEVTVDDLAATTAWHPSMSEGLVQAARKAAGA